MILLFVLVSADDLAPAGIKVSAVFDEHVQVTDNWKGKTKHMII